MGLCRYGPHCGQRGDAVGGTRSVRQALLEQEQQGHERYVETCYTTTPCSALISSSAFRTVRALPRDCVRAIDSNPSVIGYSGVSRHKTKDEAEAQTILPNVSGTTLRTAHPQQQRSSSALHRAIHSRRFTATLPTRDTPSQKNSLLFLFFLFFVLLLRCSCSSSVLFSSSLPVLVSLLISVLSPPPFSFSFFLFPFFFLLFPFFEVMKSGLYTI